MTPTTPIIRRSAAALVAGALILSACGSSGGSDAAEESTTTAAQEKTTTTTDETTTTTDETTTTSGDAGQGPTIEQLEGTLPDASDFGEGWVVDESETPEPAAIETATETACPDAAALLAPADDDEATQAYTGPDGETVRVTLAAGVDPIDNAMAESTIASIDECGTVTAEEGGLSYSATFDAAIDDTYGDGGVQITAAVTITDGTEAFDVTKYRVLYTVGSVGVTISGGDGLADDGTVTPIDTEGLDAVAAEMAKRVEAL